MSQEAELKGPIRPGAGPGGAGAAAAELGLPKTKLADGALRLRKQRSLWGNAWRQFRRHRLAMAGLVVFVFLVLATFVGTELYPKEIDTLDFQTVSGTLSWDHP